MQKLKPLKKFGQNYLTDKNILTKIVNEINPVIDDNLIEIGPGLGSLTDMLIQFNPKLTAIEIDSRAIEILKEKYPQLNLIHADFLKLNINELYRSGPKLKVVGNIPYNITSPIIFKLIESHSLVSEAVFMIQHEVAVRMTASSGNKDYGILAVILKKFCEVELCFKVSPNVFYPKPKVYSAVIHIRFKELEITDNEKKVFIALVKAMFNNRRKTIKNSLSNSIFGSIDFSDSEIDLTKRAEQLELNQFENLTEFLINTKSAQLKDIFKI